MENQIVLKTKNIQSGIIGIFSGLLMIFCPLLVSIGTIPSLILLILACYVFYVSFMTFKLPSQIITIDSSEISLNIGDKTYHISKDQIKNIKISQYVQGNNIIYLLLSFLGGGEVVINVELFDNLIINSFENLSTSSVGILICSKNDKLQKETNSFFIRILPTKNWLKYDSQLKTIFPEKYIPSINT
jgi:hypothetical protein